MKKCWKCGSALDGVDQCPDCQVEQLNTNDMFWWKLLGFVTGIVSPLLISIIVYIILNAKRVAAIFDDITIKALSRWAAVRKSLFIGAIVKCLFVLLGIIIFCIAGGALISYLF